ncbi:response regulator [Pantanalinema rosaneae CENA516]|uniref:hybrid sensor histidine kinase/response regulator n=1 Tax=Pantanalinema rosaneae TaxID=1620701 RepID=UPI003D6E483B
MMKTILVIEDEPTIREIITEFLEDVDFQVISAENGARGIELAVSHTPDLILCDIMMPELDGYGVLTHLRSQPHMATIPFVFLTAKADKPDMRQGMELGADDYVTKPFTRAELLNAVNSRLDKQATVSQHYRHKLDDLRSSISYSLPHELLTPLNGVAGLSDYLKESYKTIKPDEILEVADLIHRSAKRLTRVVQNTLLYARLHLLSEETDPSREYLSDFVEQPDLMITRAAQTAAIDRAADLHLELDTASVRISEPNLIKIVEELVDNACKFSEPGTPIQVRSRSQDDRYILEVSDQGRGMTPTQVADVGAYVQFERKFYEQQGSGLGLAIVRQLVQIHSGELVIDSEPNHHTIVRVSLPMN